MIRKITGKNNNTPTKHLTHNNLKITDDKDIANHLAKNVSQNSFAKNQSKSFQIIKTKAEKVKIKFQSKNTESHNQPFPIAELKESLNKAHNTAVGPDKIHYQFLKELPEPSTNFLLQIYNLWNRGDIPKIWKETTVIPIPKPFKDNAKAKNYRPIFLSSCVCKTLERMVNARLIWYLETNKLIIEYCHVIAHGDEEVRLILSSRVESALSSSQKVTVKRECGSRRGDQVFALSDLRLPDTGRRKREKPNDWLGPQNGSGGSLPLSGSKGQKSQFLSKARGRRTIAIFTPG